MYTQSHSGSAYWLFAVAGYIFFFHVARLIWPCMCENMCLCNSDATLGTSARRMLWVAENTRGTHGGKRQIETNRALVCVCMNIGETEHWLLFLCDAKGRRLQRIHFCDKVNPSRTLFIFSAEFMVYAKNLRLEGSVRVLVGMRCAKVRLLYTWPLCSVLSEKETGPISSWGIAKKEPTLVCQPPTPIWHPPSSMLNRMQWTSHRRGSPISTSLVNGTE